MERSPRGHMTHPVEQGRPPSDILCSTDISRETMGGGWGGFPPVVVVIVVVVLLTGVLVVVVVVVVVVVCAKHRN